MAYSEYFEFYPWIFSFQTHAFQWPFGPWTNSRMLLGQALVRRTICLFLGSIRLLSEWRFDSPPPKLRLFKSPKIFFILQFDTALNLQSQKTKFATAEKFHKCSYKQSLRGASNERLMNLWTLRLHLRPLYSSSRRRNQDAYLFCAE